VAQATADLLPDGRPHAAPAVDNYLTHSRGALTWAFTLDHKRIGVL
jgi:cytochrome c oxidase subunit 1